MEPQILFEDENILVLDKPAQRVVNDASTTKKQNTIQSWLRERNRELRILPKSGQGKNKMDSNFASREGIVHRLDKETSGILLVAKDEITFKNLQEQFKKRLVKKEYLALVHGRVVPFEGEINVPTGRLPWNRERFGVIPGGKPAKTFYKVKKYYKGSGGVYSLLKIIPKTGRTHQIRVHLKYLGFPIVSDSFYAGRKQSRKDRAWCPRLFLHAAEIEFNHPVTGNRLHFQSSLPEDLRRALDLLTSF